MTNAAGTSHVNREEPIDFTKEIASAAPAFMNEPEINEAEKAIWKTQVIIPCTDTPHAFLGPISLEPETPEINSLFPCIETQPPLIFTKGPFDLSFVKSKIRTEPKTYPEYIAWLDKVQKQKGQFWKEKGIFDLIQISRYGPKYHNELIFAALHFWNPSNNSLHLKCGMLTPTLLDVAGLTSLKPTGYTFNPDVTTSQYSVNFDSPAYGLFIANNHDTKCAEVSADEHVAFLTYWLSMHVFCSRSVQVPKKFMCLASQLHEGTDICLSKLILGSLYETLNQTTNNLRDYPQTGGNLVVSGPIWLFQLWLLAIFGSKLASILPSSYTSAYSDKTTEGIGLAMFHPDGNKSSQQLFENAYTTLLDCPIFTPMMAPFTTRKYGPNWFKEDFPTTSKKANKTEINAIWEAYLTPTYLSSRLTPGSPYGVYGYQPNHVARQFGMVQSKPSSLFKSISEWKIPLIEPVWKSIIQARRTTVFEPTYFSTSFACSEAFFRWWRNYYTRQSNRGNPDELLPQLTSTFHTLQNKDKKTRGTHIKEIQQFQRYYQTAYNPLHPRRTVYYAAQTLRDKIREKIPETIFPPGTPNKYLYVLEKKMRLAKFPSCNLALAFRPPYPKWLLYNFKFPQNNLVTYAKCNLYQYNGELGYELSQVRIETPSIMGMIFSFAKTH